MNKIEKFQKLFMRIHKEMAVVIQIGCVTGKFQLGKYKLEDEYKFNSWKKIK